MNIDRTRSENPFNRVEQANLQQSRFDLSHDTRFYGEWGQLLPFLTLETLPMDRWSLSAQARVRHAPLIAPIQSRVNLSMFWFFVPNTIIWKDDAGLDGWQTFITRDPDLGLLHPTLEYPMSYNGVLTTNAALLVEYMGFPRSDVNPAGITPTLNALPIAAYWKIWNDFFRNPQIQEELQIELIGGANDTVGFYNTAPYFSWTQVAYRNWNMDYFTGALPEPQAETLIKIPSYDTNFPGDAIKFVSTVDGTDYSGGAANVQASGSNELVIAGNPYAPVNTASIAQLRLAESTQLWLEKLNRTGTRYRDVMRGFWGSDPMAGVIDFAEYIGSVSSPIAITDVMQTADTTGNPLGDYAGKAIGSTNTKVFNYTTKEHGFIIGIFNIQPRSSYGNGVSRMWTRSDRFDYAWPQFAQIGDQAVLNREIGYLTTEELDSTTNTTEWAYVPRYQEYRYAQDISVGGYLYDFDYWHVTRKIDPSTLPALNHDFITTEDNIREIDVFQKTATDPTFFAHIWNQVYVNRSLPKYGIPAS